MSYNGPYVDIWKTLTTKGYVEVVVATHRVTALIETVKKRKWRQNVRRRKMGIRPYEHMVIRLTPLSSAYVKVYFEIPQNYLV
jgi:hypothetical protein